jgi:F-type H+-transporting ATPase subunit delta
MQAASRRSYATALESLDALAAGATPEQLRTLADELLTVAGLLSGEVRLRRAMSDPGRSAPHRVALLRDLLGPPRSGSGRAAAGAAGRVGRSTLELLEVLVAGRWSAASELLDACEQLGVQALLASAAKAPGGAGTLAEVEDELFRFGRVVAGDPRLAAAIGDRSVPATRRAELAEALLSGKAAEVTIRLVLVALGAVSSARTGQGFGGRSVEAALARLVELAAQRRDRSVAYVTVATPLAQAEEQRLGAALAARYGRDISVKITVDPRVVGGARVQIGADLYDGTIARRLAQARTALAAR